ncbi:peptidoglycan DD-metalloendopeptidase family protein [Virgibacillus necropolis]|uniref:Stage II sporulation protein n=1 Tax=Virgibacillus necropolis TaxID=163877 RepID=A0A221M8X4_9BACI|nr:peptidoglycan DD-metalloendopeptidase family protein [Virgibacillus necropolis]ASN04081.1 stage II sporulation protein [Virgibacillus necropolis]
MKEEKNGGSKNKWSRIFRKKWFFPAVYLTVAALLLTFVVWYQNLENQIPETQDNQESTETATDQFGEEAQTVMDQQEVVKMPVSNQDQAEIVTKFYDYNADEEAQKNSLVLYNSRYYQSTGVDIAAASNETFDVTASLSGTVEEVEENPLLGNVVTLSHDKDLKTYYASLGEVSVKAGDNVKQGDVLGTAGQNLFGSEDGVHVHFEIRKGGESVNPEDYFNQPVSEIKVKEKSESDETKSDETQEKGNETPEGSDEQSTTPEEETSGTPDDATESDGSNGTEEDGVEQEDPSGMEDDPTNQEENTTPDDSTNQEDGMSNDDTESSESNAGA